MLSSELEFCLNEAFQSARERRHEFMTVEHLLLALTDFPQIQEILTACKSNVGELRRQLADCIGAESILMAPDDEGDVQPTLGFQRVLQRAVYHVQSSGKREVTGANVLVAIFSEKQSQAVRILGLQNISRLDVCNYISHANSLSSVKNGTNEPNPIGKTSIDRSVDWLVSSQTALEKRLTRIETRLDEIYRLLDEKGRRKDEQ